MMKPGRGTLFLPPWDDPLHSAEDLLMAKTTSSLLVPSPALAQERKQWINVWRAGWVAVGSPKEATQPSSAVERGAQQNATLKWGPCHSREHSVHCRKLFNLKVICAFQKTAALTLINNGPAQPCWSR